MLLHNRLEAGYNLGINFEAGRLTALKLSLNGIFFMIQTQQLVKLAIECHCRRRRSDLQCHEPSHDQL